MNLRGTHFAFFINQSSIDITIYIYITLITMYQNIYITIYQNQNTYKINYQEYVNYIFTNNF